MIRCSGYDLGKNKQTHSIFKNTLNVFSFGYNFFWRYWNNFNETLDINSYGQSNYKFKKIYKSLNSFDNRHNWKWVFFNNFIYRPWIGFEYNNANSYQLQKQISELLIRIDILTNLYSHIKNYTKIISKRKFSTALKLYQVGYTEWSCAKKDCVHFITT